MEGRGSPGSVAPGPKVHERNPQYRITKVKTKLSGVGWNRSSEAFTETNLDIRVLASAVR